jgi:dolichol-phosphate mannosyltransferase
LVIPLYNEEDVVPLLYRRLCSLADGVDIEMEWLFVNDGSTDSTLLGVLELAARDARVKVVNLSRNFGHQVAITAGIDLARGEAVVVMDGDLQDPPELIEQMYGKFREGYDVVYAQRRRRKGEGWFKLMSARAFYWFMRKMVHPGLPSNVGDFRLMSRPVVDVLRQLPERHRFLRGLVSWIGFRQTAIGFDRPARAAGETKYPLWKMVKFALDAMTSFSYAPLRLVTVIGLLVEAVAVAYLGYNLYLYFFTKALVQGWTSIVGLLTVLTGSLMIAVGLLGEYVGRIHEEMKGRPLYIVRDLVNLECKGGRLASGGIVVQSGRLPDVTKGPRNEQNRPTAVRREGSAGSEPGQGTA